MPNQLSIRQRDERTWTISKCSRGIYLFCAHNFLHFTILLNVYFMHFTGELWLFRPDDLSVCAVLCYGCDRMRMCLCARANCINYAQCGIWTEENGRESAARKKRAIASHGAVWKRPFSSVSWVCASVTFILWFKFTPKREIYWCWIANWIVWSEINIR